MLNVIRLPAKEERLNQKFLFWAIGNSLSMENIDHLLRYLYTSGGSLENLGTQYRRKKQNSRRDGELFEIEPHEFLIMLLLASHLWPDAPFGQGGLTFSRNFDNESNYRVDEAVILLHGLNSKYARARQHQEKTTKSKIKALEFEHLHSLMLHAQKLLLKGSKGTKPDVELLKAIKDLLSKI